MKYIKFLPWAVVVVMGLYVASKAMPPSAKTKEMDLYAFGKIPVQHGGRIQPFDSLARNTLTIITGGRQQYVHKEENREETRNSTQWLLDLISTKENPANFEVFRIDNPDLRTFIGLKDKPGSYRYSVRELQPKGQELMMRSKSIRMKKSEERDLFEAELLTLMGHVDMMFQLQRYSAPGLIPDPDSPNGKWKTLEEIDDEIMQNVDDQAKALADAQFAEDLKTNRAIYEEARTQKTKEGEFRKWLEDRKNDMIAEQRENLSIKEREKAYPQAALFLKILKAYRAENVEQFNANLGKYYAEYVSKMDPTDVSKASSEAWMNHFEPFTLCFVLYIIVMSLAASSWLTPSTWNVGKSAFYLACLTFGVHTLALILRMFIGSRPPVTNLYSSAVFIGWGCLVMCIIMEALYKNSLANFVGGLTGMSTMLIARFLSQGGDTLEMLQAVLDTNFWLATHVTIVTLGYTATFVGGALGAVYIFAGMFSNALRKDGGRAVYQMTYGTICFATLLSFVGTVLGGIWADQSWGRFWGWDPKENGAVLIVIWNALVLHARWAGMIKSRGFAVMAVCGNIITAWSWFGTNQLGIGLHAYGFNSKLAIGCAVFWVSQAFIMILGMIPLQFWASFDESEPVVKTGK